MSASRVCIHAHRGGQHVAIDVVLPSHTPVTELLPAIVGLIDDDGAPAGTPRRWRLNRPASGPLDESLSLKDNDIRDGELLVLDEDQAPRLGVERMEPWHRAIAAQAKAFPLVEFLPDTVGVLATVLGSMAMAWTAGSEHATLSAIVAAVGVALAGTVAVTSGYRTAACLAVVATSGATGFVAVPSGPAAPNVFLATAAIVSAALLMIRLSGRASAAMTAIAAASLPTAVATLIAMSATITGAVLSTGSLTLLALAPRATATVRDAAAAHAILTGLVSGSAAAAAAGAAVVAFTGTTAAAVFGATIGAVLVLRARTHVDPFRHIALIAGGLATLAAALVCTCGARHELVSPIAGGLIVGGLVLVRRPSIGAVMDRLLGPLECVALVAVVPGALWAADVLP